MTRAMEEQKAINAESIAGATSGTSIDWSALAAREEGVGQHDGDGHHQAEFGRHQRLAPAALVCVAGVALDAYMASHDDLADLDDCGSVLIAGHGRFGGIVNRILLPMINEAVYCLYHGVGTRENIDTVMRLGMNHPMGPLALADLIGLDTCLAIMETLYNGFKDSKYRPCPLLRKYVEAGWLGRKTGRGFYTY